MTVGDTIQAKREWLDQDETYGKTKYLVKEDHGDRVLCQTLDWEGPISPSYVYAKEWMEVVEKPD